MVIFWCGKRVFIVLPGCRRGERDGGVCDFFSFFFLIFLGKFERILVATFIVSHKILYFPIFFFFFAFIVCNRYININQLRIVTMKQL